MSDTKEFLQGLMKRYTTDNVADPVAFKDKIDEFLAMEDWEMEGYTEEEKDAQRQKSIKFEWGHNHDFGSFKVDGVLGDRHINILATFIDDFGLPRDLTGKSVLDVGVWCGGTSLLLAAMGARVNAIEEVQKYADCTKYMAYEFGLWTSAPNPAIFTYPYSIYETDDADNIKIPENYYDYIIFPGVLYHLSDPILALRILFNALKDGGELFIETLISRDMDCENEYGITYSFNGLYFPPGQTGNNWLIPTGEVMPDLLESVGFFPSERITVTNGNRLHMKATRSHFVPMLQAGLSRRIR